MPIKILPENIVSLIAAGEVIESPASVLKELIENSIDAKAKSIDIEIKKAGKELIRVKDDGCGMSKEDLKLCVYPHSTSKIDSYDDLNSLNTYGFRGEALYSAYSVSKIKIQTYDGKSEHGFSLEGEGGDPQKAQIKPAPPSKGTIIEIRDLFFNTPARKKFLKSDNSLKAALIRVVEEFILSKPDISFSLKIDSSPIFEHKSSDLKNSVKTVFMPKTAEKMIDISSEDKEWRLYGKISDPSNLISSRTSQYYFVNGRAVECDIMRKAVYKAYEHIRNGRHPALALFLEGPAQDIDVNVHPQKKQVKFKDENFIYSFVLSSIYKSAMEKQTPASFSSSANNQDSPSNFPAENQNSFFQKETNPQSLSQYAQEDFLNHIYKAEAKSGWYKKPLIYIGQIFDSLLIFQTPESVLIADQHAAVERILFEKYLEEFRKESIKIQDLLIPAVIELTASGAEKLMLWKDWLLKAGFEINRTGPNIITAYSSPSIFYFTPEALKDFFVYLSEVLGDPAKAPEELKRNSIATLACKKSIKAREKIDPASAVKILEELNACEDSLHCPHGRPTLIEISLKELTARFERTSL
ncbi:MAG: DNA mismatch repair endonuclease MutL [Elusimicrobia bacterium]|nr:DNA mismatch repair endonuclease MutL [Elusimicrobiota bacterium]